MVSHSRMPAHRDFQVDGAATEKVRWASLVCMRGMTSSGASEECRARDGACLDKFWENQDVRYNRKANILFTGIRGQFPLRLCEMVNCSRCWWLVGWKQFHNIQNTLTEWGALAVIQWRSQRGGGWGVQQWSTSSLNCWKTIHNYHDSMLYYQLLLVCMSWTITGQPQNSVFIRRV